MLIENESMIILEGNICTDLISGDLTLDTIQKMKIHNTAENSFIRNNSVIQCISPSVSGGTEKLKLSVMYKPAVSCDFSIASVKFSRETECRYEIRCQNEIIYEGNCQFSEIRITPSETENKLELEFVSMETEVSVDITSDMERISLENETEKTEVTSLEQKLVSELEKKQMLESRKEELNIHIDQLKNEVESMTAELNEYNELMARRDVLRKDLEEVSENIEKIGRIKKQLEFYDDILVYYKNDEGYTTVSDRISELVTSADKTELYISELAERRKQESESISDELNM